MKFEDLTVKQMREILKHNNEHYNISAFYKKKKDELLQILKQKFFINKKGYVERKAIGIFEDRFPTPKKFNYIKGFKSNLEEVSNLQNILAQDAKELGIKQLEPQKFYVAGSPLGNTDVADMMKHYIDTLRKRKLTKEEKDSMTKGAKDRRLNSTQTLDSVYQGLIRNLYEQEKNFKFKK